MIKLGSTVRILSSPRTNAIGKVIEVYRRGYLVRLPNWQADGYHLDCTVGFEEVEESTELDLGDIDHDC